ncbi:hypothetical protein BIT28_11845 [Photobacterium proteolyticum]|uniref:Uncharacterized protein n=2 Tax=Photobacterium proteolyticum TaxID=1903952 RepID=A0A1Q9GF41_9GAMM|nr:hypothetical protein BIT28_11845 [Photobacterium proteolyticum]
MKSLESKQQLLIDAVKSINDDYQSAIKREESANKRAFISSIVKGVLEAASSGFNAYTTTSGGAAQPAIPSQSSGDKADDSVAASTKERLEKETAKVDAETEVEAAKKELDDCQKKHDSLVDDRAKLVDQSASAEGTEKEKNDTDIKDKDVEIEAAKKTLDKAREAYSKSVDKLNAAISALEALSKSADDVHSKAIDEATSIANEKMIILNCKHELEREQRDATVKLVQLTESLKNSELQKNYAETAVMSLALAIRALAQIVASLSTLSLFWSSMGEYCKYMSKSEVKDLIKELKEMMDIDERKEFYETDEEFRSHAIHDLAKWKALSDICNKYQKACLATHASIVTNIALAPSISESHSMVKELANGIIDGAKSELVQKDARLQELDDERNVLTAAN